MKRRTRELAVLEPSSVATPVRGRPWSTTAERMRKLAAEHPDPKVRAYARRWLEARGEATT